MSFIRSLSTRYTRVILLITLLFAACKNDDPTPIPGPDDVTSPPSSLHLNSFYTKYIDASGIPVVSSSKLPDKALVVVRNTVRQMMSARADVLAKLIKNKIRVGIMATGEVTTNMPEHSDLNTAYPGTNWNQYRGLGATKSRPLSSCAEENVMCHPNDPYFNEDILIHEFAHGIHHLGISGVDAGFDEELEEAFNDAVAAGLWENTYAGSNYIEYFAEGVQDWFNVNAEAKPTNGIHNAVNTREELKIYDPTLYEIIKRYFPEDVSSVSCHSK